LKETKLSLKYQIFYGIGVSYAIVDQIFAQWVLYYYLPPENSGLTPIMAPIFISLALILSRFVDMISDPLVGFWSDRVDTKWGRRIPFIAGGIFPLALATIAFFYPILGNDLITFIYLTCVGSIFFVFYTIVGAPYNAMIPEIGKTKEDRLNLSTWQSVFRLLYTAIAMITPGILIKVIGDGDPQKGVRGMVITLAIFSTIPALITIFGVPEKKLSHGRKSTESLGSSLKIIFKDKSFFYYLLGLLFFFVGFNTLRGTMNYFVEDVMEQGKEAITIASAVLFGMSALFFYPTNKLCKKIGYKKPMLVSLGLLMVLTLGLNYLGRGIPKEYGFILFGLIGIPVAGAAFIYPPAMLSEIGTRITKKSGTQVEGMCFGIQGFFLKLAFLISIAALPIILVSGSGSIIDALVSKPQGVEKAGVYATTIFSSISFGISFIFYLLYPEK
jgi:GPH family glycoside/pentoside/hexuronide:cation symporter